MSLSLPQRVCWMEPGPSIPVASFSSFHAFLHAVVFEVVWLDMLQRSLPEEWYQYGIHLTALGPPRLPQRPIFTCTLLAATYVRTTPGDLRYPYQAAGQATDVCLKLQQQLYDAVTKELTLSPHVSQILHHASWCVPNPWSRLAQGFVYHDGLWREEKQ